MSKTKTDAENKPDEAAVETANSAVATPESDHPAENAPESKVYPAGHNGNNQRISDLLREARFGKGVDMLAVNRKLKAQVARLQAEAGK